MLINGSTLVDCPVLSLHVGGEIARVTEPIIDPDSLKIIGFKLEGELLRDDVGDILPIKSLREFSRMGMIVDSLDEFVKADDVLRIRDVLALNFDLAGLKVVTKQKVKLGKVTDYTVEVGGWTIQQIIVQRPMMKAFFDPQLTISRKQIIEVDDYKIVVKDEHERTKSKIAKDEQADFIPNFVNPFREPDFASEKVVKQV